METTLLKSLGLENSRNNSRWPIFDAVNIFYRDKLQNLAGRTAVALTSWYLAYGGTTRAIWTLLVKGYISPGSTSPSLWSRARWQILTHTSLYFSSAILQNASQERGDRERPMRAVYLYRKRISCPRFWMVQREPLHLEIIRCRRWRWCKISVWETGRWNDGPHDY